MFMMSTLMFAAKFYRYGKISAERRLDMLQKRHLIMSDCLTVSISGDCRPTSTNSWITRSFRLEDRIFDQPIVVAIKRMTQITDSFCNETETFGLVLVLVYSSGVGTWGGGAGGTRAPPKFFKEGLSPPKKIRPA